MARSARELFDEAMRLDPEERAALMRPLIDALDAESEEGVDDAWRVEIERRMAELDSGSVEPIPWEEIRSRALIGACEGRGASAVYRRMCSGRPSAGSAPS